MTMKRYTPEELTEVLRLHRLWLDNEEGGVRAYLAGAYLAGANLDGANLVRANLAGAYLVRAYLDGANLAGAYLAGANLVRANLAGAYLVRANLDGANLDGANLDGANLDGAYLDGANLDGANLVRANLAGAYLDGAKGFKPFVCVGPIGSRRGYTTVYLTEDHVRCGCFDGTLGEFEAEVKDTHAKSPLHLAEYTALIAMVRSLREAQPPRAEAPATVPAFTGGQEVRLTEAGRERWPWAPTGAGRVLECAEGWTHVDFPTRYLSVPDGFLELAEAAKKDGAA